MTDTSTPLERYTHRLRRQRLVYFSIVTVIVVALGIVAGVAWSRGEVNNSALHTASAPPSLRVGAPDRLPTKAWSTDDRAAIGSPQSDGTVVVFGQHTVRGVDARSGKQTWSYTRSNRTVCTAAQLGGVTIAVFEVSGNCDEVTAVDSGTGRRKWDRTLDMDGMPLDGHPTFVTSTQGTFTTLLVDGGSVIYALDPSSGYNRWTFAHYGCTVTGVALGTAGALISQNCSKQPCPAKLKFCGNGPQLLLRNAYDGRDDKSDTNPDKIIWNRIGNRDRPVSADGLISALDLASGVLHHLDGRTGAQLGATPLSPRPTSAATIRAVAASGPEVIWARGVTYAISSGVDRPLWTAATLGPPTLTPNSGQDAAVLATARITVPSRTGASLLDGNTGHVAQSFTLSRPPGNALVYPLGTGFLVASASGTAAYR